MWDRWSHLSQPLTVLTSNKETFKWTYIEHKVFEDIKRIVSHDTLLEYPDVNENFNIHTEASYYQLGTFVSQALKPIPLYSWKITFTQPQYTVTEN